MAGTPQPLLPAVECLIAIEGSGVDLFDLQLTRIMHAGISSEHFCSCFKLVISLSALEGIVADTSHEVWHDCNVVRGPSELEALDMASHIPVDLVLIPALQSGSSPLVNMLESTTSAHGRLCLQRRILPLHLSACGKRNASASCERCNLRLMN